LDDVRLPKFPASSSTPLSAHRLHPDRLHTIVVPRNRTVPLLLRCRYHTVASSSASPTASTAIAIAAVPGNHAIRSVVTIALGNHVVLLAITAA
jgi:hypothetical protein